MDEIEMLLFLFLQFMIVAAKREVTYTDSFGKKGISTSWKWNNYTYQEMANILQEHGYVVRQFPNGPPVVVIGDMAYSPDKILPELSQDRTSSFKSTRMWKDSNGVAQCWYFFDTETKAHREQVKSAVQIWTNSTCIRFNQLPEGPCEQKYAHGAICVGDYDGCWSAIGLQHADGKETQKLSCPGACGVSTGVHEFGHALGFYHMQSRPDRNKYVHVNVENFGIPQAGKGLTSKLKVLWQQGAVCKRDQVADIPVPFDFLSVMQYRTAEFGDKDHRAIFVAKDVRRQYMLDYRWDAGLIQSHYDLYTVNTLYGCDKIWTQSCMKNGKTPPKCKNLGYVGKDCNCHCPKSFTGSACETKVGPVFPLLPKVREITKVTETSWLNLDNYTTPGTVPGFRDDLKYIQYISLVADGNDADSRVSITVIQHVMDISSILGSKIFIITNIKQECSRTSFIWGVSKVGQVRTECLSSMTNNELEGPWYRGRTNHADLLVRTDLGIWFSEPSVSIHALRMKLHVEFSPRPDKKLTVKNPAGNNTNSTVPFASKLVGLAGNAGIGIIIGLLILLLLLCPLAVLCWRRKMSLEDLKDPKGAIRKLRGADDSVSVSTDTLKESDNADDSSSSGSDESKDSND